MKDFVVGVLTEAEAEVKRRIIQSGIYGKEQPEYIQEHPTVVDLYAPCFIGINFTVLNAIRRVPDLKVVGVASSGPFTLICVVLKDVADDVEGGGA